MFEGAHYADPLLTWLDPVAVTDIEFLKSSSLGASYTNNLFAGDHNNGNLYYFELNPDRTALLVLESVPDLVVDNQEKQSSIIFGEGFGSITDLVTGPGDGYLYVLSYTDGTIYRVIPA
jgi:aldose sugar dehydrogenase